MSNRGTWFGGGQFQRHFGSDLSVWRDGDRNGFVRIALAGLLAPLIELARSVRPFVPREGNVHLLGANIRSNGTSAAISRCGVTAIGTAL